MIRLGPRAALIIGPVDLEADIAGKALREALKAIEAREPVEPVRSRPRLWGDVPLGRRGRGERRRNRWARY